MSTDHHRPPEAYSRRVLLALTGLIPQVVTETLYALAVDREPPFVPTEIHLLTTAEGAERARLMLLDPEEGRFYQLCGEYGLDRDAIRFDAEHVHVVAGADGGLLADITCDADNTAVANAIAECVRRFTADPDCAVHASIAGGRKTMGFYLGYALSLFGREQDRLSHVLVSQPFESDHQFYFPPVRPKRLIIKDRPVHTSDARVMLSDIPFVRLRPHLPETLLREGAGFSEAVRAAQETLGPPDLVIDLRGRCIRAGGRRVDLPPADLAFLSWFARRRLAGKPPLVCPADGVPEMAYAGEYLDEYRAVIGLMGDDDRAAARYGKGMGKAHFEERKSKLKRLLTRALGRHADDYLIQGQGRRPKRYSLMLSPSAVRYESLGKG